MFRFSDNPATITVADGVKDAWNFFLSSWTRWIVVVLIVAAGEAVAGQAIANVLNQMTFHEAGNPFLRLRSDYATHLPQLFGLYGVNLAVTFLSTCYFFGLAMAGLRNRPLTLGWLIARGLTLVAAALIAVLVIGLALVGIGLLIVLSRGLGVLVALAAIPVGLYFAVRFYLAQLAVFDGAGPLECYERSWQLTAGAAWRTFGWLLMAVLLVFVFGFVAAFVEVPFGAASPIYAQFVAGLATASATVLVAALFAVLYESQRARRDPSLYPFDRFPPKMPPLPWGAAPGWSPPPGWTPPATWGPPGGWGPQAGSGWQSGSGSPPPYPPDAYPPGAYPPQAQPPTAHPPGAYPPSAYPPQAYPPTAYPPQAYPPAAYPPHVYPPAAQGAPGSGPTPGLPQAPDAPMPPPSPPAADSDEKPES